MNYRIAIRNSIADSGLEQLSRAGFLAQTEFTKCDGILVRSERLDIASIPESCKAIARAGVGVNNVPVDELTERGVVVFNAPGGNANSVKELVIAGLLLASRPIVKAVQWTSEISPSTEDLHNLIESRKKEFVGSEISGKTLGVIGLGAIGVQVSNAAESIGMEVLGHDPYITVLAAWGLSSRVQHVDKLEKLFKLSDYITIHVPLNEQTRNMIDAKILEYSKPGLCILNFARGELVNVTDTLAAIKKGRVRRLITDFPSPELLQNNAVIITPHLGASTIEAERNCARMATVQLIDFLQNGNIVNAVNFPNCKVERSTPHRITITNINVPSIVGQITSILASEKINIQDFTNRHKNYIAYNIIDTDVAVSEKAIAAITEIEGVVAVRAIPA